MCVHIFSIAVKSQINEHFLLPSFIDSPLRKIDLLRSDWLSEAILSHETILMYALHQIPLPNGEKPLGNDS